MEWLLEPQIWISLCTLTFLEIVLGIDNIIFIAILADKLPENQRGYARKIGLTVAVASRLLLLLLISVLVQLTTTLFTVFGNAISGRDLILVIGGVFLLFKSTIEIHHRLEGVEQETSNAKVTPSMSSVIIQIMLLDIVFSLDSIITAIGLVTHISIMVAAILISLAVMLFTMNSINSFIDRHPTIKMLALSFLLLIGVTLIAEGLDHHIPKGYIYFAMAFSVMVEVLNIKVSQKRKVEKVHLHKRYK